jgi:hypothetical protein
MSSAHHLVANRRGVVDQDVNLAVVAFDPLEQGANLGVVGVVDGDGDTGSASRVNQSRGLVNRSGPTRLTGSLGAAGDVDGAAVAAQRVGDGESGSSAGAGDDGDDTAWFHR